MIDKQSPLPLHYQLTNELKSLIKSGEYKEGDLFATDKQLMEKYHVSITTVRRALAALVSEGYLERMPGKGTFVKKESIEENLGTLVGFFEQVREKGLEPSADIVDIYPLKITNETLERIPDLNFFHIEDLLVIEKIQKMNGQPVVYLRSYWPYEIGRKLKKYDLTQNGIYEICTNNLGLHLDEADETIFSAAANELEANYLGVKIGDPLLCEKRESYMKGQPIELSFSSYPADRYKYKVKLKRNKTYNGNGVIIT